MTRTSAGRLFDVYTSDTLCDAVGSRRPTLLKSVDTFNSTAKTRRSCTPAYRYVDPSPSHTTVASAIRDEEDRPWTCTALRALSVSTNTSSTVGGTKTLMARVDSMRDDSRPSIQPVDTKTLLFPSAAFQAFDVFATFNVRLHRTNSSGGPTTLNLEMLPGEKRCLCCGKCGIRKKGSGERTRPLQATATVRFRQSAKTQSMHWTRRATCAGRRPRRRTRKIPTNRSPVVCTKVQPHPSVWQPRPLLMKQHRCRSKLDNTRVRS